MARMKVVAAIVNHVATRITMSLVLVIAGANEVVQDLGRDFSWQRIGAHHGVIVFGLFQLMRAVVEITEGLRVATEEADEAEDEESLES